jgi:hypothetical protein
MPDAMQNRAIALHGENVRFGSQADVRTAKRHVRFTPDSDQESDFSQKPMSALTQKADMCGATRMSAKGQKRTFTSKQQTDRLTAVCLKPIS